MFLGGGVPHAGAMSPEIGQLGVQLRPAGMLLVQVQDGANDFFDAIRLIAQQMAVFLELRIRFGRVLAIGGIEGVL